MHLHILSLKKEIRCPSARPTYSKLPDKLKLHTIGSPSLILQGAFGTVETVVVVGFQSQAL